MNSPLSAVAALACVWALPALAQEAYTVDPAHTYPTFEVSHLGFSTQRGTFTRSSGRVVLDRVAQRGAIDISIDAGSLDTGHAKRDEMLRGEDFFDAARHATIAYRSTALKFDGDTLVGADGELTLLGVTRPVPLRVSAFKCGVHPLSRKALCGADATATLRRSEFGMKAFIPAVGDDVRIVIQIEAFRD